MNTIAKMPSLLFIISVFLITSCIIIPFNSGGFGKTSLKPVNLSVIEKQVLYETNLARSNPRFYAQKIRKRLRYYDGRLLRRPGKINIRTREGKKAVIEAINYLMKVRPMGKLKASKGMSIACRVHVKDQGRTGKIGHYGSDGSSPFDRMKRYGKILITAGENLSYGPSTGEDIVIQLIIDDGVSNRGHRKNIFNEKFTVIGIAFGFHPRYGKMCAIDYAGGFIDK